jgi:hypothetical protein
MEPAAALATPPATAAAAAPNGISGLHECEMVLFVYGGLAVIIHAMHAKNGSHRLKSQKHMLDVRFDNHASGCFEVSKQFAISPAPHGACGDNAEMFCLVAMLGYIRTLGKHSVLYEQPLAEMDISLDGLIVQALEFQTTHSAS